MNLAGRKLAVVIESSSRTMIQNMCPYECTREDLGEEWSQIPFHVFYNLVRCYGRRLHGVLLAMGGCTKY